MNEAGTQAEAAAEARTEETQELVRRVTRRQFSPEEKVRVVLEGFRREVTVNDLCRREGIKPNAYYAWLKDFMEAGKTRLRAIPCAMPARPRLWSAPLSTTTIGVITKRWAT